MKFSDLHDMSEAEALAAYQAAGWPVLRGPKGLAARLGAGLVTLVVEGPGGQAALEKLEARYGALGHAPRRDGWNPQVMLFRSPPGSFMRTVHHLHGHAKDVHLIGSRAELILPPSIDRGIHQRWAGSTSVRTLDFLAIPFLPQWLRELIADPKAQREAAAQRRQIAIPTKHLDACSDIGNAERFARDHGTTVRWCPGWGTWLVWDEQRWKRDEDGEVVRRAIETVRKIAEDASRAEDAEDRKTLAEHALRSESRGAISALLDLAKSQEGLTVQVSQLDADEWTLCVRNGLLDLRTGELRPHDPDALCTKLAPVEWDPDADTSEWDRFITTTQKGDTEVVEFLRRAVGYSLTGSTREQRYFFIHGRGATGKSTFVEAIKATLGDYARTADTATFMESGKPGAGTGPQPELVRLVGSRFVPCTEVEDGARLAVGVVKRITGGDTVTVRDLYAKAFEFTPSFKVWMVANTPPRVSDRDDAIFRRVVRVPFENVIPQDQRDPELRRRLVSPELSGPAILRWAVQGARDWIQFGLRVPAVIDAATQAYRDEQDPLRAFWQECVFEPSATTPRKALREAYERWNKAEGTSHALSPKAFAQRVRERLEITHGASFTCDTTMRVAGTLSPVDAWRGIAPRIVHPDDEAEAPPVAPF